MQNFPPSLLSGYRNFMSGRYKDESERYRALAETGQKPQTLFIACCDSRAAPETIFDCGPGELFVMRNVANMVPPFEPDGQYHGTSSAIEYAVQVLKVKDIVVMGHGRCGGIRGNHTLKAFIPGGASAPWFFEEHLDLPLEAGAVGAAGSMLGSGAIVVMDDTTDMVAACWNVVHFFARES